MTAFLDRHYLLLRRLHSLSGIFPIGLFLFPHLTSNSSIVWGQTLGHSAHGHGGVETFQHEVNFIHGLPALVLIEIFGLWLPLLFHAAFGVYFASTGRPNVDRYKYQGNWRYLLQRLTGYVGVVYIFLHLSSLRWGWDYGGLFPSFEVERASSSTAAHFQHSSFPWFVILLYLVGVLSLVFHFANGLWTAAITWGLTVSATAQKRWGYVCTAVGLGLAAAGCAAVIGFATLDIDEARRVEYDIAAERGVTLTTDDVAPSHRD